MDYVISASLDTATKAVTGEERITYTNNSPDTLRYLWLQLDQNLFTHSSLGFRLFPQDAEFGPRGSDGGFTLTNVAQPALVIGLSRPPQKAAALAYTINGTMMRVDLPRPLPPRTKYVFDVAWSFPFGAIHDRMGVERVDGDYVYEVAQWYPRLAVYDDVRGWNTEQYISWGEFYLEYGGFDVSLTVPANMIVAATGVLQNPVTVLTSTQRRRLAQARTSDQTVMIRSREEIGDPASRPASATGMLTWHFTADSVRDFAWAAAPHFIWDAVGVNGGRTLAMSFYPPTAAALWREASQYAKATLERFSTQWFPYPYPVASNINGREKGGMEYPMIVFCGERDDPFDLYSVTDHEFGHSWFPMIVGNNERLYGWMDEGLNSFMNHYSLQQQYPDRPLSEDDAKGTLGGYLVMALSGNEQSIMTPPDRLRSTENMNQGQYNKPALGLVLLRDRITSPQRFDPVFREYIRRWAFKHPTPADFFRTMNDGLGEDLSWFWRAWFYTTETMDQAVDSVVVTAAPDSRAMSRIYLSSPGAMPMPVEMDLLMDDGSTQRLKLPGEIWYLGPHYVAQVPGPRIVTRVTLDPDAASVDVRRENDRWPRFPSP